ncbi:GNAT family N-acetyltransferase [Celeribacter sp. SCSIO 80788]|uniref:GNAT family N-acetyltransferase n=1 Tax=Celeribacter sp. SCSIO 80788 TaxID=3117013 RepID=UPI003DA418E8
MDTREITDETHWEELADTVDAPLSQRWLYGEAAKRIGRDARRFVISDRRTPLALAQVLLRPLLGTEISVALRGPLFLNAAPDKAVERAVVQSLRAALPFGLKLMSPDSRLPGTLGRLGLSSPPEVVELDLRPPLSDMRLGLNGKWRNALKKAEKSDLHVTRLAPSPSVLRPYLLLEKHQQAQRHYRGLPPEFALALQDVAPKSLRLFEVDDAFMLFILHGTSATYQIGHTGPRGRAVNAHNLILWEAIKRLKLEGVRKLDLGMIDTRRAPDLARFKLRTGATARVLSPAALM